MLRSAIFNYFISHASYFELDLRIRIFLLFIKFQIIIKMIEELNLHKFYEKNICFNLIYHVCINMTIV